MSEDIASRNGNGKGENLTQVFILSLRSTFLSFDIQVELFHGNGDGDVDDKNVRNHWQFQFF